MGRNRSYLALSRRWEFLLTSDIYYKHTANQETDSQNKAKRLSLPLTGFIVLKLASHCYQLKDNQI